MKKQPYNQNGIFVNPVIVRNGDNLKITYDGLLAKSGAAHVILHIGEGENFFNVQDVRMEKIEQDKFEATVHVQPTKETVNFCFKDCANNWDNNYGKNYVLTTPYQQQ
ncbi:carbohydrate-binding protein [Petroclostridium sp. X23]|uniref:carbohydrate-binding protein n=1 Tax=Petroclostridium sp. X23 TaxID=3045146 RepID=UPI0024ACB7DD|nr:carbohydrate-binding protein [Petroclostridium sp. X23]WHH60296.1 carbohydrate-binding protein [Petroclostridium sp. X23]